MCIHIYIYRAYGTKDARPLFWSLTRLYKPIGTKCIAVLSKMFLLRMGLTTLYGKHTLRMAPVSTCISYGDYSLKFCAKLAVGPISNRSAKIICLLML